MSRRLTTLILMTCALSGCATMSPEECLQACRHSSGLMVAQPDRAQVIRINVVRRLLICCSSRCDFMASSKAPLSGP